MADYQITFVFADDKDKARLIAEDVVINARNLYSASEKFYDWLGHERKLEVGALRKIFFDRVRKRGR